MGEETETGREVDYMNQVDVAPEAHADSTAEEQGVLRDLYGEPDDDGIYRWTGEGDGGFDATSLAEAVLPTDRTDD